MDVKLELDDPPTREEIKKATMQLKVGKSPGIDGIPAEVYQHGGEAVLDKLQDLFTNCWEEGTVLPDLWVDVIVSLYKKKKKTHTHKNEKRRKIRQFKLPRHHRTLRCKSNLGSCLAEHSSRR